jgi:hypothetical protein
MKMLIALMTSAALLAGCGSEYTIVDRSTLEPSNSSRLSARNLLPDGARTQAVSEHLALANEVYSRQLTLLKQRRNKLRSRRRWLGLGSFTALAGGATGVGISAMRSDDATSKKDLEYAGMAAIGSLAVGTFLQVAGYMQEDVSAVDERIRHLQMSYDGMLDRIRGLSELPTGAAGAPTAMDAEIGTIIERFIGDALQINVKG